jgi:hypothetical protein
MSILDIVNDRDLHKEKIKQQLSFFRHWIVKIQQGEALTSDKQYEKVDHFFWYFS